MNPFTQSLLHQLDASPLLPFVTGWDALETLVIEVFREKRASATQAAAHRALREDLLALHEEWKDALEPFWRRAKVKGRGQQKPQRATEDPFAFLLRYEEAEDFAKSRDAFLMLPAARETLNTYLLAQIESGQ